ncbi:MAG: 16S rRNA (guanine(527)-N(7))-methyltransferase RsmG [Chloroflexota bacterium]|nr:16S rRNA (guanine(527)-N(7))-methyltransferase RsmG [Chloroflexota bacterium]
MDQAATGARGARDAFEGLLADAPHIARELPPGYLDAIEHYVALLLEANRTINLTRLTDARDVAKLHLLDALAALPIVDEIGGPAIDLGSGGGVPAIPLALARPTTSWTLVDSVAKKAAVLRDIAEALGLNTLTVLAARAETLGHDRAHREAYRLVTARACAPLPVLAELALPLVRIGGSLVAWKGPLSAQDEEWRSGLSAAAQLGGADAQIVEPGLTALGGHRFVVVAKRGITDQRFPRRPGEPSRRPLA